MTLYSGWPWQTFLLFLGSKLQRKLKVPSLTSSASRLWHKHVPRDGNSRAVTIYFCGKINSDIYDMLPLILKSILSN